MSKFRRFAPIEVRFLPFAYFPVDKNREEIRDFRIWEGGKFGFLAKIFTLVHQIFLQLFIMTGKSSIRDDKWNISCISVFLRTTATCSYRTAISHPTPMFVFVHIANFSNTRCYRKNVVKARRGLIFTLIRPDMNPQCGKSVNVIKSGV